MSCRPNSSLISFIPIGEYDSTLKFDMTSLDFDFFTNSFAKLIISLDLSSTNRFLSSAEIEYGFKKNSPRAFLESIIKNVMSGENLYN